MVLAHRRTMVRGLYGRLEIVTASSNKSFISHKLTGNFCIFKNIFCQISRSIGQSHFCHSPVLKTFCGQSQNTKRFDSEFINQSIKAFITANKIPPGIPVLSILSSCLQLYTISLSLLTDRGATCFSVVLFSFSPRSVFQVKACRAMTSTGLWLIHLQRLCWFSSAICI